MSVTLYLTTGSNDVGLFNIYSGSIVDDNALLEAQVSRDRLVAGWCTDVETTVYTIQSSTVTCQSKAYANVALFRCDLEIQAVGTAPTPIPVPIPTPNPVPVPSPTAPTAPTPNPQPVPQPTAPVAPVAPQPVPAPTVTPQPVPQPIAPVPQPVAPQPVPVPQPVPQPVPAPVAPVPAPVSAGYWNLYECGVGVANQQIAYDPNLSVGNVILAGNGICYEIFNFQQNGAATQIVVSEFGNCAECTGQP